MANSYCDANSKNILRNALVLSLLVHGAILVRMQSQKLRYHLSSQSKSSTSALAVSLVSRAEAVKKPIIKKKKKIAKKKVAKKQQKVAQVQRAATNSDSVDPEAKFKNYIRNYKKPIYPRIAQRRRIEGKVTVDIRVNRQGIVTSTTISKSSGHKFLDDSVIEAAKKWVFKPLESQEFISLSKNVEFIMKI